jgi:hypothetical protein
MMTSNEVSDIVLDEREIKRLKRYEGARYVMFLLIPLLCVLLGTADLLIAARLSVRLGGDLPGLVAKWLNKQELYAGSCSGGLILAFDKLEGAIMFYGLALGLGLMCLGARQDRRLFRRLLLLCGRTR